MADIIFVAIALAFFALSYFYVRGCERIVGRDEVTPVDATAPSTTEAKR